SDTNSPPAPALSSRRNNHSLLDATRSAIAPPDHPPAPRRCASESGPIPENAPLPRAALQLQSAIDDAESQKAWRLLACKRHTGPAAPTLDWRLGALPADTLMSRWAEWA